jgi:hypothetical protein
MGDPAVERAPAYWLFPVGAVVAGAGYRVGLVPVMVVGALILAAVALRLLLPSE